MTVPFYRYQWRQPGHTQAPLRLPHVFLTRQIFTKSFPSWQFQTRNLAKTLQIFPGDLLFPWGDWATSKAQEKLPTSGGICKDLSCQKALVGEGGELERALVDITNTGKTVRPCCEKRFEKKNFAKDAKILQLSWRNLEIRANSRIAFRMFEQRVVVKQNKKLQSAERPWYQFSVTVRYNA